MSARVYRTRNLPMTLDFLFFEFLTGVVVFVGDLVSFCDDPDEIGGFPPKNDRISIFVELLFSTYLGSECRNDSILHY